ncbi:type I-F CRISPR-associated helicase Cas3f [Moraxella sp. FZLJ2107]|uniref:type I-F CRISPR-associated helicase Cas3f n=1 Tax=unclassified Moraxella TaxID=2685852 RepID=UPI0020C9393F|nr:MULTISPECIES: type I-F CRISPR-associated helicase Cas3f [unclassified Moraxella]UTO04316.1 type I-F CRISPR-associated helicase Cas3f [Moraxella sp. FZLJ2107]UTO23149.1 type I-F CRISPR-associated helicase Cas3f [Moraxella sp. FZLJ2109]
MIVTFISQCEKKALPRTRQVLDAFANRIGDNTWQTVITEDGLAMVKKLLSRTASKSTAVSCYRFHTRKHSELVWIVGNRHKFNEWGYVPVNRTKLNILHSEWQNDWQYISAIQIMATLSALLHDLGKSTLGFQHKLTHGSTQGDPYRHEWISLKILLWLCRDCQTDNDWLQRFGQIDEWLAKQNLSALNAYLQSNQDHANLAQLPPLGQWLAWLVVSHHRLPPLTDVFLKEQVRTQFQKDTSILYLERSLAKIYAEFTAKDYWVKNPNVVNSENFFKFQQCVINSKTWQNSLKRWARKALQDPTLQALSAQNQPIDNAILLYLSRLCLMVGDHNYSSLKDNDPRRVATKSTLSLLANTDRKTRTPKQFLDEHLLGVASFTAHFARHLPTISEQLPTLLKHRPLSKNTEIERFSWQNHAFKIAKSVQAESDTHGFFGVSMASTGCGKTIGNARIMYGLSDEKKGARLTIALGLRVLTLQTGLSLRQDLQLNDEQLAILVGGGGVRQLFEINEQKNQAETTSAYGSESAEELVDGFVDGSPDYHALNELNIDTLLADNKAKDLLFSPVVTCTIDHLMQACECKRGGGYIAPMLRLLSSDLILDEPDDFDHNDLPALARLVHLAGVFGSKVLLSSATLPPDLIAGLFESYLAGRKLFNQSQNKPTPQVVCAWFDEQKNGSTVAPCGEMENFRQQHQAFVNKRTKFLHAQPIRRKADVLPVNIAYHQDKQAKFYTELGQKIIDGASQLHQSYHTVDEKSGKCVSVGLVRLANIKQLTRLAFYLQNAQLPADTHIHVACYHARQLLILRNHVEYALDKILKRNGDEQAIFAHDEIRQAMAKSHAKQHIFMVLATPVAEVGRDHDYDWAIVEPSSMRSIIQLAGRVWRHRPQKLATFPNLLIWQKNIRHLQGQTPVFTKPGFEVPELKLPSYEFNALINQEFLDKVDACPRIDKPSPLKPTLAGLEHRLMTHLFSSKTTNYVNAYWRDAGVSNRIHTHLQQVSPFRHSTQQDEEWILIPKQILDESETGFDVYASENIREHGLHHASKHNHYIQILNFEYQHPQIDTWLVGDVYAEMVQLHTHLSEQSLSYIAIQFSKVRLNSNKQQWYFCPFLGVVSERFSS